MKETPRVAETKGVPSASLPWDPGSQVGRMETHGSHQAPGGEPEGSEGRLQAIFSAIPDQILRLREDGTVLDWVNHGDPSPLDPRTSVGSRLQDLPLPPAVKAAFLAALARALAAGGPESIEYQLEVGGTIRHREARLVRCGPGEALGLIRDITDRKLAEEDLRQTHAIQSLILENGVIGIAFIKHRIFEWVNDRVSQMVGLPPERIRGASTRVLFPDDAAYQALGREAYPRLALGEKYEAEIQLRRSDGSLFWCRFVGVALDKAHPQEGSIWLFEDSSERRRAQDQLQEHLHFLQALLDAIPSPVFFKGADLRYQGCNQAMEAFLGLSRSAMVGKTAFDIAPPDLARIYQEADAALLASGESKVYQAQVATPQGGLRDVIFHKAVFSDLQGEVAGLVGVLLDITEREAASRELADTKVLLEAILEQSPMPIVVADAERVLRIGNRAARRMLGTLEEPSELGRTVEALSRSWTVLDASGREVATEDTPLLRALAGEKTEAREYRIRRKDGSERICQALGAPIRDREGRLLAGLIIFPDISEQRRAEEALRRAQTMESLGLMAQGIAHDFNNLFQGLEGLLELAQVKASGETATLLAQALGALERAATLSNQVLDYSGKSHRELGVLDLNRLIQDVVDLLPGLLPEVPPITLHLDPTIPDTEGDHDQIHRVITALLLNALEASSDSKQPVEVRTELISIEESLAGAEGLWVDPPKSGLQLRLTVRDHGPGIPPEHLGRIFDPFFSTKEAGRGLGLAAALGLIRGHGAGLHVASTPGQGCCMAVFLPVHVVQPNQSALPRPPVRGRTILLVDDEPLLLEVMGEVITDLLGRPLLKANDGQEALELFRAHADEIGLVVMDATMPRLTGPEAFESMKRIRPDLRAILCSGFSESFGEATAASHGFQAFLKKPFPLKALREAIERALGD